jgi:hypothetical protein
MEGQQMQIMVAQQALGTVPQGHETPQHAQVVGSAVDQIAQQKQSVSAGRELQFLQQFPQSCVAALHIANQVKCHGKIVLHRLQRLSWICC